MTARRSFALYTVKGDRGVAQIALMLQELACGYGAMNTCFSWSPAWLDNGMRRCDIRTEGFTVDLQWVLDTVQWGARHAVMVIEMVTPTNPGEDYDILTFRPQARA